jgi:hypothetical protein
MDDLYAVPAFTKYPFLRRIYFTFKLLLPPSAHIPHIVIADAAAAVPALTYHKILEAPEAPEASKHPLF